MATYTLRDLAQMMVNPELMELPSTSYAMEESTEIHHEGDERLHASGFSDSLQLDPSSGGWTLPPSPDQEWSLAQITSDVHPRDSQDEWAVSFEGCQEENKKQDWSYNYCPYKEDQTSVLDRHVTETAHSMDFGSHLFEPLYLDTITSGMEPGTPVHLHSAPPPYFTKLDPVFSDEAVSSMVEHHIKRTARLPLGPSAACHVSERKRSGAFEEIGETPQGELMLENFVVLSDASMNTDPLKMLSVNVTTSGLWVKDLVDFRKRFIDTSEKLKSKKKEKLAVHYRKGHYSIALGTNSRRVVHHGNDNRSFLCHISKSINDTIDEFKNIPGIISRGISRSKREEADRLCRIEFDSFRSYDNALVTYATYYNWEKFIVRNNPEVPTSHQQLCMHLKWFTWPSKGQAVIELNEEDVERCIFILEKHDFLVSDMTAEWVDQPGAGKIIIKGDNSTKFHQMWHYERELKQVIDKIFRSNAIAYRRISLMRKKLQDVDSELHDIVSEVNRRIIMSAFNCDEEVWSHRPVPDESELDRMADNISQLPWSVSTKNLSVKGVEAILELLSSLTSLHDRAFFRSSLREHDFVRFDDDTFGKAVIDYMMPRSPDREFFSLLYCDSIGVRIYPFFRINSPVPRKVVSACIADLSGTDLYFGDAEPDGNSTSVNKYGTRNSFGRILANDRNDSLLVELWPESIIPGALTTLNTVLEGRIFDCSREPYARLLFGRGLEWLTDLAELSEPYVVLRVDRLKSRLVMYGAALNIDTFVERIHYFCSRTNEFVIGAEISLGLPRFLPCIPRVLAKIFGRKLLCENFGDIVFNEATLSIMFRGSLEKLNLLNSFLDELNEKIVLNTVQSPGLFLRPPEKFPAFSSDRPACPVCACSVQLSSFCLDNCGHYYCLECLTDQIKNQTQLRQIPWKCLNSDCEKEICISDVKELMCLNNTLPFWYIQQDMEQFIDPLRDLVIRDGDGGYFGCDTPSCTGLFRKLPNAIGVREDDTKIDHPTAVCLDCGVVRCLNCMSFAHDGISCFRHARIKDDVDVSLAHFKERNKNARNCPNVTCGAVIIKDDGCNHVFCPYCKTHFCWVCFKSFDCSQTVYSHMHAAHGSFGGGWVIENDMVIDQPFEAFLANDGF